MIKGEQYFGLGSDLWSCGVVLFTMVCGYLPFDDNNTSKIYKKIVNRDF
jgi:5'-AMP-activated protein kinase catalytic alpha subunit